MANPSKQRGTAAETAVVRAAQTRGFPHSDRLTLSGARDRGDVRFTTGLTAGVVAEVKGGNMARTASDALVEKWLDEAELAKKHTGAAVSFLVVQRGGHGLPNAHRWHTYWRRAWVAELTGEVIRPSILGLLPVRMSLEHALLFLREHGYGEPLTDEDFVGCREAS